MNHAGGRTGNPCLTSERNFISFGEGPQTERRRTCSRLGGGGVFKVLRGGMKFSERLTDGGKRSSGVARGVFFLWKFKRGGLGLQEGKGEVPIGSAGTQKSQGNMPSFRRIEERP